MNLFWGAVCIVWGFASGIIISTGVVSFINAIGIIPRLAMKAKITTHYLALANASLLGVIVGTIFYIWDVYLPLPKVIIALFALAIGLFVGCLAVAVAEVLNVIPIMENRLGLKRGMYIMILSFAVGKMIGSLFYYLYPGFY